MNVKFQLLWVNVREHDGQIIRGDCVYSYKEMSNHMPKRPSSVLNHSLSPWEMAIYARRLIVFHFLLVYSEPLCSVDPLIQDP